MLAIGARHLHAVVACRPVGAGARAAAARTDLRGIIILTGSIPNHEVPKYLAAADIGLQPGAIEYSAPLKLIEYMAAGLAIVAPRTPSIEEVFTDGVNAVLFDPQDDEALINRLTYLHGDPQERRRLADRARQDAHPYTWTANARKVLEVIGRHGDGLRSTQLANKSE